MRLKKPKKERAAAPTTAPKHYLQSEPYPKSEPLSSWKMLVGELLLFGDKKKKVFWPFFDVMLRQYVDLRLVSKDGSGQSGATI